MPVVWDLGQFINYSRLYTFSCMLCLTSTAFFSEDCFFYAYLSKLDDVDKETEV